MLLNATDRPTTYLTLQANRLRQLDKPVRPLRRTALCRFLWRI
jgi:hypothetical protein